MLLSMHVTRVLGRFNNFALTTGFYWSYTHLLKSPILMCYCDYTLAVITEEDWKWGLTAHTLRPSTWSCWKMSLVRRLSSFLNTVKVHVGLCKIHTSCVISWYCINTWVTSSTYIFRQSQLHQCDQEMLPNRFSIEELLVESLFQKTCLATFLEFLPQPCMQPRNSSRGRWVRSKRRNWSWYTLDLRRLHYAWLKQTNFDLRLHHVLQPLPVCEVGIPVTLI